MLWLWRRPAAIAANRPLAWEPPYAASAALKDKKKKKRTEQNRNRVVDTENKQVDTGGRGGEQRKIDEGD